MNLCKENQVDFEAHTLLNMGQWLSIPLVMMGVVILIILLKKNKLKNI